jgi:sulfur-carrier protein
MAEIAVMLAPVLTRLFPGCPQRLALEAATVGAMIDALDARWPGMRDRLCDSTPQIRRHVNVFVDGERASLETSLKPGAAIFIVTAISGG